MFYGSQQIVQVNGRNGADAFTMQPNSSAILMDANDPLIWVCVTDGAGYKTVTPYKVEPYIPPKPVDLNDILYRLEKLENESHTTTNKSTKRKSESNSTDEE